MAKMADTKALGEVRVLSAFLQVCAWRPHRAQTHSRAAHTHTHTHIHTRTHIDTYIHTYIQTYIHTYTQQGLYTL
jgi:hypothetical protein